MDLVDLNFVLNLLFLFLYLSLLIYLYDESNEIESKSSEKIQKKKSPCVKEG